MSEFEPLRYHGDSAAAEADLDFAVNVHAPEPPAWLRETLHGGVDKLGSYPAQSLADAARAAVAAFHGVLPEQVLLLNGAAEGFAMLARLRPAWPVVIHPGFTEPEACLEEAGCEVERVILDAPFTLAGVQIREDADMVVIGNPTNPTGVLHPVSELSSLARPWRHLIIDEAFLDVCVPGAPGVPGAGESMIPQIGRIPGLIVLRSLTKTWSIAGLRCGYLISDADTVARLARGRAAWPLGTLQLLAIRAVMERGVTQLPEISAEIAQHRAQMVAALTDAGFTVHPSDAPYLLVQPPGEPEELRLALAARGIAVRRCDTFPGLDSGFWRLAVRTPEQVATLLSAVRGIIDRSETS